MKKYKICFIGDTRTGKTSMVRKITRTEEKTSYPSTHGVEITEITLQTNYGQIELELWDCAGKDDMLGLESGYYIGSDGAVIFYNESARENAQYWKREYQRVCENNPFIIVHPSYEPSLVLSQIIKNISGISELNIISCSRKI